MKGRLCGIIAQVVVLTVVAACAAPTPTPVPPTPTPEATLIARAEDIVGTWVRLDDGGYARFNGDGTHVFAETLAGLDQPPVRGTFSFQGSQFIIADSICDKDGTYELVLQEASDGTAQLRFRAIDDGCQQGRRDILMTSRWRRFP